MEYPFQTIQLNGREVSLQDIIHNEFQSRTSFEQDITAFIRQWLTHTAIFEIPTSGSTGTPGLIRLRREQMIASAEMTREALGLKRADTSLICLHVKYIAGKMMLVRSLETGMKIIANEPIANPLANIGDDTPIDFAAFVPLQVYHMVRESPTRIGAVGTMIIGGGPLDNETEEMLARLHPQAFVTYGMTETISHVALRRVTLPIHTIFYPLPGIALQTTRESCLVINAPFLNDAAVTNDVVTLINGGFEWLGRKDNVINTGGIKVVAESVEVSIMPIVQAYTGGKRFFVAGIKDQKLGQKVVLLIEGAPFDEPRQRQIINEMLTVLDKYAVPHRIHFIERFRETENGKIQRIESLRSVGLM